MKYNKYFYILGVVLLVFAMFKIIQQLDLLIQDEGLSTFEAMQRATLEAGWWAIPAVFMFWLPEMMEWKSKGMKVEGTKVKSEFIEAVFPSYGRDIPKWAQGLRFVGAALFIYTAMSAVSFIDGNLDVSSKYIIPMVFGGILFFCLPFFFQQKDLL